MSAGPKFKWGRSPLMSIFGVPDDFGFGGFQYCNIWRGWCRFHHLIWILDSDGYYFTNTLFDLQFQLTIDNEVEHSDKICLFEGMWRLMALY